MSIDISALIEKVNLVDYISQYTQLEKKCDEYIGLCPLHNERTPSFYIREEENVWHCQGCNKGGNIFGFIMNYHSVNFQKAVKILLEYLDLDEDNIPKIKESIRLLRKYSTEKRNIIEFKREILDKDVMLRYNRGIINEWVSEGIDQDILDRYDVRYDRIGNRIVMPIYDNNGNIINIMGRTLDKDFKSKKIAKYIYYYKLGTTDFLFGYYQNLESIRNSNEIIVVEGAKSVFKLEQYGFKNSVAILTSHASEHQIRTLIQERKNVILALDKGVKKTDICENFKYLKKFTNVYFLDDKDNLLNDKDSPVDRGFDIFNRLYENKVKL